MMKRSSGMIRLVSSTLQSGTSTRRIQTQVSDNETSTYWDSFDEKEMTPRFTKETFYRDQQSLLFLLILNNNSRRHFVL